MKAGRSKLTIPHSSAPHHLHGMGGKIPGVALCNPEVFCGNFLTWLGHRDILHRETDRIMHDTLFVGVYLKLYAKSK